MTIPFRTRLMEATMPETILSGGRGGASKGPGIQGSLDCRNTTLCGVGTMLSQLMNSYLIKRLNLYNGRLLVFKMALGAGLSLLFLAGNVICLGLDALDSDHHYACGFHVVARKA